MSNINLTFLHASNDRRYPTAVIKSAASTSDGVLQQKLPTHRGRISKRRNVLKRVLAKGFWGANSNSVSDDQQQNNDNDNNKSMTCESKDQQQPYQNNPTVNMNIETIHNSLPPTLEGQSIQIVHANKNNFNILCVEQEDDSSISTLGSMLSTRITDQQPFHRKIVLSSGFWNTEDVIFENSDCEHDDDDDDEEYKKLSSDVMTRTVRQNSSKINCHI